ncbi:MAG: DNA polymerase III subunit gamma/tau [Opitutus sp.]
MDAKFQEFRLHRARGAVHLLAVSTGYQVIARKWRPQTFKDVVGQDHVVRTLTNAIGRNRIAHAYLFVGPRGTGKTSTARIFAKALNCTNGPKADFDPADPACVAIAEGSHLDVIEIDGASNNGVDQVRDLRDTVQYAPAQGTYKVYIIDEVHMLSAAAFNALLKTLEEPPAHVKFVFATTDPQKVLPTIISRCQRFDLKPIPSDLIVERLKKIADAEKIKITDEALACIARMADGGMRDAQSVLDQMISFCGTEISEPDVLDVYGLVSAEKIAELGAALSAGDHQKLVAIIDECDANGRDLVRLLSDLQAHIRTALLDAIAKGGKSALLGESMTTEQITRMLDGLREGEGSVKLGLAEKINFEVTLLKAIDASRARAIDSLIKELAALADDSPAAGGELGEKKKG